jgi:hypothetical protein
MKLPRKYVSPFERYPGAWAFGDAATETEVQRAEARAVLAFTPSAARCTVPG